MTPADVSSRLAAGFPRTKVAVPCEVRPGAFASERQFIIRCADGEEHVGICDAMYVSAERGLVCGRIVGLVEDCVKVIVPGNDVVTVRAEEVVGRWEGARNLVTRTRALEAELDRTLRALPSLRRTHRLCPGDTLIDLEDVEEHDEECEVFGGDLPATSCATCADYAAHPERYRKTCSCGAAKTNDIIDQMIEKITSLLANKEL